MQRRAAAVYAALFVVVAAGAYGMVGVAQEPVVSLDDPDYSLSSGDDLSIDGRTYTATVADGSGELVWVEESVRVTESWDNGSTITFRGAEFTVLVDPAARAVDLVEVQSLPDDVTTVEDNGTTFVVVQRDGERVLVSQSEYLLDRFGLPRTHRFTTGDSLEYEDRTVTLASVSDAAATIEWTADRENTVAVEDGANVTLNGRDFVAHFPDANTLELESDYGAYAREVRAVETYTDRVNGLWAVSLLSALTAVMLVGMAYMPSRY